VAFFQLRRQQPDRRYACRLHNVNHFSHNLKFYAAAANGRRVIRARPENLFQAAAQRFLQNRLFADL
jgi:hypothetical protein